MPPAIMEIEFLSGFPFDHAYAKTVIFGALALVAIAFIPNPENKPEVNHKKGIRTDNRVSELEWVTHAENLQHAYNIGLRKPSPTRGVKNRWSKINNKCPLCRSVIHKAAPKVTDLTHIDILSKFEKL